MRARTFSAVKKCCSRFLGNSEKVDAQRDWDAGWAQAETTILQRDVWLLTDHIKRNYLNVRIASNAHTLEVGCGSAKLSALLAQQGARVTALDASPHALQAAQRNFSALAVQGALLRGDAFHLPFPAEKFDAVLSTGLLEHFRDPVPVVAEMTRVLRAGGLFFSDVAPLKFSLLRLGMYARGMHKQVQDEFPFTARDIEHWLRAAGLREPRVFASGVVPPLGIFRRVPFLRAWSFRHEMFWTKFDGTQIAERLGFFYLAWGIK